jgi:hypothetical protein
MRKTFLSIAAACAVLTGCSSAEHSNRRQISRHDIADWPLSVESGTLACEGQGVTFESNGVVYAVNGTAKTRRLGRDIDPIWAAGEPVWITDPKTKKRVNVGPPKKNIGNLIAAGLALCSE